MNLTYFYHTYNSTISNERCVEVSLGMEFVKKNPNFIEVGAVLPYYGIDAKRIIDCFDPKGDDEKRLSECDIRGENVLCISTLEHFGTSEYGNKKRSNLEALAGLLQIITTSKNYLITIPLGFNKELDKQLAFILPELNCYGFRRSIETPLEWKMVRNIKKEHFDEENLYNHQGFSYGNEWIYGANFIIVISSEKLQEEITFSPPKITHSIDGDEYNIYKPILEPR